MRDRALVVRPEVLEVEHRQVEAVHHRERERQAWQVAAREDVFEGQVLGHRPDHLGGGREDANAAGLERHRDALDPIAIAVLADVLVDADRDVAIVGLGLAPKVAVIALEDLDPFAHAVPGEARAHVVVLARHGVVDRDVRTVGPGHEQRHIAPAGADLDHPRLAQIDLTYHDIRPGRGLHSILERRGLVSRVVDDAAVEQARTTAPTTTRAALRGDFITAARDAGRDFTVDWVHLKVADGTLPIVTLTDPFAHEDPRVDDLISSLGR